MGRPFRPWFFGGTLNPGRWPGLLWAGPLGLEIFGRGPGTQDCASLRRSLPWSGPTGLGKLVGHWDPGRWPGLLWGGPLGLGILGGWPCYPGLRFASTFDVMERTFGASGNGALSLLGTAIVLANP